MVLGLRRAHFCADPPTTSTAAREEWKDEEVTDASLGAKEDDCCDCRAAESWL